MHEIKTRNGVPIQVWADPLRIETTALAQLYMIAQLPWVAHLAVMPDVHWGMGATVGSVIAMRGAVSPAAVGVDIGCGMIAASTNLTSHDLPDDLAKIRHQVERDIPVGFHDHGDDIDRVRARVARTPQVDAHFLAFGGLTERVHDLEGKARRQIGTLGGGNHFIELCLASDDRVWLMLHSGSRNIGKVLADHHISIARTLVHNQALPDRDLAVFLAQTPEMDAYRRDLQWAQRYAWLNRAVMLELYVQALKRFFPHLAVLETVGCHHNYLEEEVHFGERLFVTRKGAIRAGVGDMGIIPGSMGTKSYIVRGLGNADSLQSASHGAGRRMSRGEAKRRFTADDLVKQTAGVECRKDQGVVDEIPMAYKDIDSVMDEQKELVSIVATLKGVMCIKG